MLLLRDAMAKGPRPSELKQVQRQDVERRRDLLCRQVIRQHPQGTHTFQCPEVGIDLQESAYMDVGIRRVSGNANS